ncbi:MAG: RuBisCO transcriptional regulator [Ramlibacter sp.]|nr:RuBisCO transcriptional regulator [Ramlibacter sp.]
MLLLVPQTLRTLCGEFPDIRPRVSEELYVAQLSKLRAGEVDVLIGPMPTGISAGEFVAELLIPLQMAVVERKGSRYAMAAHGANSRRPVSNGSTPARRGPRDM